MFSTNKNRKIGMLIFLFVVSFIVGMLINIQRLGSLPMKLIQVEWNDTVGCVYENLSRQDKIPAVSSQKRMQHNAIIFQNSQFPTGCNNHHSS